MKVTATIPLEQKNGRVSVQNNEQSCQNNFLMTQPVKWNKKNDSIVKAKKIQRVEGKL